MWSRSWALKNRFLVFQPLSPVRRQESLLFQLRCSTCRPPRRATGRRRTAHRRTRRAGRPGDAEAARTDRHFSLPAGPEGTSCSARASEPAEDPRPASRARASSWFTLTGLPFDSPCLQGGAGARVRHTPRRHPRPLETHPPLRRRCPPAGTAADPRGRRHGRLLRSAGATVRSTARRPASTAGPLARAPVAGEARTVHDARQSVPCPGPPGGLDVGGRSPPTRRAHTAEHDEQEDEARD